MQAAEPVKILGCGSKYIPYHRTWTSWQSMRQRCNNKNRKEYKNYGGRGITICERWQRDFFAFLADMGERPEGTSLDRIRNEGDYEPGNCRWSTRKVQNWNRRRSVGRSKYLGVFWETQSKKWVGLLRINGKQQWLGKYKTEEEAARRYNQVAIGFYGYEYPKLNREFL